MDHILEFLIQHGEGVLFAVVFAEQVGLPIPAIPILIAAGALAGGGQISVGVALLVSVVAALGGDLLWYELGRRRGRRVLNLLCRISLEPDSCVRRTEQFFTRHGARSLLIAKFLPGLSTIAPPLAGIVGLSVPLFLLYDGVGALLWAGSGISLGYVFSDQVEDVVRYTTGVGPALGIVIVAALLTHIAYAYVRRHALLHGVTRMTVSDLVNRIQGGHDLMIIDLRPSGPHDAVPAIPGAVRMSMSEVGLRYQELPRERDIVFYCACPLDATSAAAALLLQDKGFTRVWPLAGGIEAWWARPLLVEPVPTLITS